MPPQSDELARPDGYHPAARFPVDTTCASAPTKADDLTISLAGRVVLWRDMGGLAFGHIQDQTGRVQISLQKKELGAEQYRAWAKAVSLGDFVGVTGRMWTTNKGERTVAVDHLQILSRAFRPMPDKHAGIADTEIRYRKRYLDLVANPGSRDRFLVRSRVISHIRRFLDQHDFIEVETPILQASASGAAARPFSTHHNALDRDLFLRISPETYLKRVIAGSFDRVYELGRNFRNEGIDSSHLQEFTMLEWYAAYWDYRDNMAFIQALVHSVLDDVCGTRIVTLQGAELDFDGDWPVIDYRDAVREHTGIDLTMVRDIDTLKGAIRAAGFDDELDDVVSYAALVDLLYKRTVRPHLIQPCFLVHHPAELVPLARRSDDDGTRLDMFQVVVNGWEIVKAYSELIDPFEQRARLEEQEALRASGDDETMMMEDDFIECMEYGMPPMSGLGLGVDRFVALITDAPTLRDVVLFPQMRAEADTPVAAASDSEPDTDASAPDVPADSPASP